MLLQDGKLGRSPRKGQDRVLRRREPEEVRRSGSSSGAFWPSYLHEHPLLHPLRLVGGAKINASKQDRLVKVHINVVPERTKGVPILEMMERV